MTFAMIFVILVLVIPLILVFLNRLRDPLHVVGALVVCEHLCPEHECQRQGHQSHDADQYDED